jgi:DNA-directed RNA polymerase specialized sigma24 family protein
VELERRVASRSAARQQAHLVELHRAGGHTSAELAELFGVARATVYRAVARAGAAADTDQPGGQP